MAAMKETTKKIFNYLKDNADQDLTATDIAEALDLTARSVNGSFTSFQKKGYGYREDAEIELDDGTHQKVKFLRLTDEGMAFDPDAQE